MPTDYPQPVKIDTDLHLQMKSIIASRSATYRRLHYNLKYGSALELGKKLLSFNMKKVELLLTYLL